MGKEAVVVVGGGGTKLCIDKMDKFIIFNGFSKCLELEKQKAKRI